MEIYCGFGTLVAAEQHLMALADFSRRASTEEQRDGHAIGSDSGGPRDLHAAGLQGVDPNHPFETN